MSGIIPFTKYTKEHFLAYLEASQIFKTTLVREKPEYGS